MEISSPVFKSNQPIPSRYTGSGANVSPPLRWNGEPAGCKEFALICQDPDAPKSRIGEPAFVHWLVYNISPAVSALPEGIPDKKRMELPVALDQGLNSFGKMGYAGPMPPIGHGLHHYHFKLFALDAELGIPPGASVESFLSAIKGHVLETAECVGIYERGIQASIMT